MKKNILIILPALDFNTEEYLLTKKTFEKEGFSIFVCSDTNGLCISETGIRVKSDVSIYNIHTQNFLGVIFIGGNGVRKHWGNLGYQKIAKDFNNKEKIVAAICAAPVILSRCSILSGKNATCYPTDRSELEKGNVIYLDTGVVVDKNIITGQSSVNSVSFSQTIIKLIQHGKFR